MGLAHLAHDCRGIRELDCSCRLRTFRIPLLPFPPLSTDFLFPWMLARPSSPWTSCALASPQDPIVPYLFPRPSMATSPSGRKQCLRMDVDGLSYSLTCVNDRWWNDRRPEHGFNDPPSDCRRIHRRSLHRLTRGG